MSNAIVTPARRPPAANSSSMSKPLAPARRLLPLAPPRRPPTVNSSLTSKPLAPARRLLPLAPTRRLPTRRPLKSSPCGFAANASSPGSLA
jgi:hypothetical protein